MKLDPDNFTPDLNDGRHIFVFGSNLQGIHGAGAAKEAAKHWGAKRGEGHGRHGNSYAIPTRLYRGIHGFETIELYVIQTYIENFIEYAKSNPNLTFLVTKIGCGYAGYKESDIRPMFKDAPPNCILPKGWR